MSFSQLAAGEAGAFHLFQKTGHGAIPIDLHGPSWNSQIFAGFWLALCDHRLLWLSIVSVLSVSPGWNAAEKRVHHGDTENTEEKLSIVMTTATLDAVTINCNVRVSVIARFVKVNQVRAFGLGQLAILDSLRDLTPESVMQQTTLITSPPRSF